MIERKMEKRGSKDPSEERRSYKCLLEGFTQPI